MKNLWRKKLSNDEYIMFTINVGPYLWPWSMHENLIMLIAFPLAHVSDYRGLWLLQGIPSALELQKKLEAWLKHPELHRCRKFHDLEGPVHGVGDPKEECSWDVMIKFIEAQEKFTLMLCGLVRRILPPPPGGSTYNKNKPIQQRRWKRRPGDGGTSQQTLTDSKRQRTPDGNPLWMQFVTVPYC